MQSKSSKSGANILDIVLLTLVTFLLIFLIFRLIRSKLSAIIPGNDFLDPNETNESTGVDPLDSENIIQSSESADIPEFYKKVIASIPDMDKDLQMFVTAQAMHETGIFTSDLYKDHNNAFGMMFPHIRETLATAQTEDGYAHYASVIDSIKDYELYLSFVEAFTKFDTINDFSKFLKEKSYYTDSLKAYSSALNKHLVKLKHYAQ